MCIRDSAFPAATPQVSPGGGGPIKSEPTFGVFGGQIAKHPQYLPPPAAVRACPVFFMAKFSPLPEALLGANGMGVSMAGLEGLWWAGGLVAGRRAPTDPAGQHLLVIGPYRVHRAVDVVEGARDPSSPCRCLTTERSVWSIPREPWPCSHPSGKDMSAWSLE